MGRNVTHTECNYATLFLFNVSLVSSDIDCGDPGAPRNGQRLSPFSTLYTGRVTYTCFTGYTLLGSKSITCQSDGQWSGSVPQCIGAFTRNYFLFT